MDRLRAYGYEPAEPYPGGVTLAWRVRHIACGHVCVRTLDKLRAAHRSNRARREQGIEKKETLCPGCRTAARTTTVDTSGRRASVGRPRLDHSVVEDRLRAAGYELLHPFETTRIPVRVRRKACGHTATARLFLLLRGTRPCAGCAPSAVRTPVNAEDAIQRIRAAGYTPMQPYPGSTEKPWSMRHLACGTVVSRPLKAAAGCAHCRVKEAVEVMRAAGLEPLEPYPGVTIRPWRCRCGGCGSVVTPNLRNVRRTGKGCRPCGYERRDRARRDTKQVDLPATSCRAS
ncbi:hypothetical protein BU198_35160 [Streptomyces sp. CBMA156]|nr:hypothetical protein [Streptomyces sp. CBMA156]